MPISLDDPLVQGALLPLLASLVLTGVIRLSFGIEWGKRLACAAVGLAFVAVALQIQGLIFPPRASTHKLPYLFMLGLSLGVFIDAWRANAWVARTAALAWPVITLAWLNSVRMASLSTEQWIEIAGYGAGFAVLLLGGLGLRHRPLSVLIAFLFGALGVGAIALIGSSALIATLAFALAAACGGFALWNWPKLRYAFGAAGVFGVGGALGTLSVQALMFTDASAWGMGLLLLLLLAGRVSDPLAERVGVRAFWLRVLVEAAVALLIVVAAVGLAYMLADSGEYYG